MRPVLSFPIALLLCLAGLAAVAQKNVLSGIVRDESTGKPLAGASVFFNGTSRGTVSGPDGKFVLQGFPAGGYRLIVSAIGYAHFIKDINTRNLPANLDVRLRSKASELASVTIEPADAGGWQKYGDLFSRLFIGASDNSWSCTIKNKKALKFHFSSKGHKLSVSAYEPLLIENKALGYTIEYTLDRFVYDYSDSTISYAGYPLFKDIPTDDVERKAKWAANRLSAYRGSVTHFMRSAWHQRLREEGFTVKFKAKFPNVEKQRVRKIYTPLVSPVDGIPLDTLSYYWNVLQEPSYSFGMSDDPTMLVSIDTAQQHILFFYDTCAVKYGRPIPKKKTNYVTSLMRLLDRQPIVIEENGTYFPQEEFFIFGHWSSTENMSDRLPLDYDPEQAIP